MDKRIIFQQGPFRIVELTDITYDLDDLKGDCFNPEVVDLDPTELKKQELAFERSVADYGVFGYQLEKWSPEIDQGWTHVDSCWGFVGSYSEHLEKFNHYIVDEFKAQIKKLEVQS